eukprot:Blabericola_migrator_1__1865@NODE_1507_length_4391_cov_65_276364_g989_i0_p1_GENE_NODE_1507_length_4391_cov_65_276364_g989_i0NODE_1507_length_4391_cov_65_276364_g989_i0_p1_ORF_typecomplete_len1174_score174_16Annexin/PF00191_20/61Annexin/PF00191_20/4_5_NODE_1507_length_4391_cov_65_276364_g989_i08704079
MTAQGAVPSRSKRTHSTAAEEDFRVKKLRCNTPHEVPSPLTEALSCEDQALEASAALEGPATDFFDRHCSVIELDQHLAQVEVEVADRAQQHDDQATLRAWIAKLLAGGAFSISHISCDASNERTWGQQLASSMEPTRVIDKNTLEEATAPVFERISTPVPPADPDTELHLNGKWIANTLTDGTTEKIPNREVQSVSSSCAGAYTSLRHPLPRPLLDPSLPGARHSATSTGYSKSDFHEPDPFEPAQITSSASTAGGVSLQPIICDQLQTSESLSGRSRNAQKKGMSMIYEAARKLLLSPRGADSIPRSSKRRTRTRTNTNMANAPYLSSCWLLERLLLHDKIPAYFAELQTAFECFGYSNVIISDLWERAMDLVCALKQWRRARVSIPPQFPANGAISPFLAVDMVQNAFFNGRSVRPDLKTYLRNKLKIQNAGSPKLPKVSGHPPWQKGDTRKLQGYLRVIKRVINPSAVASHPLDFTVFFNDVSHLVITGHSLRKTVGESVALTDTKPSDAANSQDVNTESDEVMAIVTKYKKLFNIDLAAEVEALSKRAPDDNGPKLFTSAIEEGYVPSNWLQPKLIGLRGVYSLEAHCLLGSIAALYRRLFENTDETICSGTRDEQGRSALDGSDASDESLELDVVQNYLLQPYVDVKHMGESTVKEFDLLSAAFETLVSWKQDPKPPPIAVHDDTPENLVLFIHSSAPFGTPQYILTLLMNDCDPEGHQHHNELRLAFNVLGYQLVDLEHIFARALTLAAAIMAEREIPFNDAIEQLNLGKASQAHVLAADIIYAAFFRTWSQRRKLLGDFAKQCRYEVLPQHKVCLRDVMAKREEWHPHTVIRSRKGDRAVVRDWSDILVAKKSLMEEMEDDHPLSFDCFLRDVEVISKGNSSAIPAIFSKYKLLFDRDIVEDVRSIRTHSPQICYNKSFVKGIEEGYVPYRWAKLLTLAKPKRMTLNNDSLCLLGAYVDYFMSLVGPADSAVSQEMCSRRDTAVVQQINLSASVSSDDEVDQTHHPPRPDSEERRAQLMTILGRAPPQKPLTVKVPTTEPPKLHPVAQYLFERSRRERPQF